jgi:3-oxoacyl-[acyl-carrier-protein] synthase III
MSQNTAQVLPLPNRQSNTRRIRILGSGRYLPKTKVEAAELEKTLGLDAGWIAQKTGALTRYFVDDETTSSMGALAAKEALKNAGLTLQDVDLIVSASGTTEQPIPCTASLIQKQLGLGASGIPCFDINSTCLSFLTALDTVSYLVAAGRYKTVLIISSEIASKGLNWKHKESCTLMGDGAAAVVISETPSSQTGKILSSEFATYGDGSHLAEIRGGGTRVWPKGDAADIGDDFLFNMQGRSLFKMAAEHIPGLITKLLEPAQMTRSDLKLVVPHQGSLIALELLKRRAEFHDEQFLTTVHKFGNTIAASIPMGLHEAIIEKRIQRGDRIMLVGTSAGLTVGGMILEY